MPNVYLLIKPTSGACNMRCAYCFYADEAEHRQQKSMGMMGLDTARTLIGAALSQAGGHGEISFSFQGGEPTLAGLSFFRSFVAMARELGENRHSLHWAIQTNGLLIDDAWARFLAENRFLTGVSVDGDRACHDAFRRDAAGQATYDRAAQSVSLLLKAGVETNLLCVVNGRTASAPKKTYRALKALKTGYIQFIPCLDPLDARRGGMKWSLMPEAYGQFLCGVFDEWYRDWQSGRYVSVRQFDDWVHLAMGRPPSACASCGQCGGYLVAEADGSLYPCDFYVLDPWKLGMAQDGLLPALSSPRMAAFRQRGQSKPAPCLRCPYFALCRGGCPRDWYEKDGQKQNYFCPSFQMLFRYAGERILRVARAESMLPLQRP